jgi:hypothetical protein
MDRLGLYINQQGRISVRASFPVSRFAGLGHNQILFHPLVPFFRIITTNVEYARSIPEQRTMENLMIDDARRTSPATL